jgi:hypothetical protein
MKLLIIIIIAGGVIASCKVQEKSIPGFYTTANSNDTQLILKEDKTFQLIVLNPKTDHLSTEISNHLNGIWLLEKNRLKLSPDKEILIDDSITRFTNISCFNFWTPDGDPVSIRSILFTPTMPRPHFGNSLYFFAQDFKPTDTLTFYFDGYPPFRFPGTIPSTIGNNMHRITLVEPYRPAPWELKFIVKDRRLVLLPHKTIFYEH